MLRRSFYALSVVFFGCSPPAHQGRTVLVGKAVPVDEAFLKRNLSREYAHPVDSCYAASLAAFSDLKYPIKHADAVERVVVTDPRPQKVNATVTTTGTQVASGHVGTEPATMLVPIEQNSHYLTEQADQYYMRISGDDTRCRIEAFRWRAWYGGAEMLELQEQGEQWARQNLFRPLFEAVDQHLAQRAY